MNEHPSVTRVKEAAKTAELEIEIISFQEPAKTAKAAAELLGCTAAQIANSLIFESQETGNLLLLLTSGGHRVDLDFAAEQLGQTLTRARPDRIREETGFVIGGVAPLGHLNSIETWIDDALFAFDEIWAAGGIAETVFQTTAADLERACKAKRFQAVP